jgi:ATPase family associated with various cellular activities (AAA)
MFLLVSSLITPSSPLPSPLQQTVARRVGRMFKQLGVLNSDEVVSCRADDLVGSYVGHTAPKTRGMFEKALGKVLFIDEAYKLNSGGGSFGQEAIDTIVELLTDERFHNRMVVVLAGYQEDIAALMRTNPGLTSRFSVRVPFEDFDVKTCCQLLQKTLDDPNFDLSLSEEAVAALPSLMGRLVAMPDFGNGRTVSELAKTLEQQGAKHFLSLPVGEQPQVGKDLLEKAVQVLCENAAPAAATSTTPVRGRTLTEHLFAVQSTHATPPPPPHTTVATIEEVVEVEDGGEGEEEEESDGGSDSVDDAAEPLSEEDSTALDEAARASKTNLRASAAELRQNAAFVQALATARQVEEAEALRLLERLEAERERLARELEEKRQAELEEKRRLEAARREAERLANEAKERKAHEEADRRRREAEEALQRLEEERKRYQEIQAKLRHIGRCVAGFEWIKQANGWRCAGGSHWVSDTELDV